MKKILSILLAMAMLISSITVAFVAFAVRPGGGGSTTPTLTAEELVEKINTQTAFIANTELEDGTTHHLPGYSFQRTANASTTFGCDASVLNAIMAASYPEYADAPYCTDGSYDFNAILKNLVGIDSANANVKKNSDASLTLGRDALGALKLDAADVASVSTESKTYVLNYNNIDIAADEKVEDSVLPDVTANYPRVTGLDDVIVNSAKSHNTGLTFESFALSLTNIKIKVLFDSEGRIDELTITYKLEGRASLSYIQPEPFDAVFSLDVSTAYKAFDYYNEGSDFDYAELAAKVNEGTANMVNMKAGYDYARSSTINKTENDDGQVVDDYSFSISSEGAIKDNAYIPIVLGALLKVVDKVTIGIDENFGTNIRTDKWQCKNEKVEGSTDICTADHPHQIWQCTCKDVAGCCTCCPTGTGCTSTHPCDKGGACKSADCQCGYINDPECKYVDNTDEQISNIDAAVNTALNTVGKLLDSSIGTSAKDEMKVGATSANIPVATTATDKLDERFAVKATELDVFDIEEAAYDSDTGAITFAIADQDAENGYKALSHLTNDYVTNEQFVEALKLSALEKLGSSVDALNGMFLNTYLIYSDVTCTVKFVDATDDNIYGTGEIERINLSYDCTAESEAMVSYRLATHMDSTAKNVEYADYEKGDVDMSTSVSLLDAKLTLRYLVDLETLNDYQLYLADMNDDGSVSIVDAKAILEKIASQPV